MKATEAKLLIFLQKSPQFVIPIYQRTCSWTEKQCCHIEPISDLFGVANQ